VCFQVKESRNSSKISKPPMRGGPSKEREESDDDVSTAGTTTTEGTLVDANVKDYQVIMPCHYYNNFTQLN
jgi:hypothetical protein